ncbi:MAG TPA: aminodeoxychorismate/anthranilate synthase component II [Calditrichia bacterium]|nr:aminodeoxychorismate/anthranilate synthase component II [Calditrichota bacterium]HQV32699.1 aminodeoxychorismate/anthranilate synthase component II [Calditrichia bacterium]
MKVLMIDNYDSFTYNLAQYLGELGAALNVVRNDQITLGQIHDQQPEAIIISPGPGRPEDAGITLPLIREFAGKFPILGVCLGHQAIGQAFGAKVVSAPTLMHGKTSQVSHGGTDLFEGLPNPLRATRYHSLVVAEETLPEELVVTARSEDGTIMALAHQSLPLVGVQFHPESFLTQDGRKLLGNFLALYRNIPTGRA